VIRERKLFINRYFNSGMIQTFSWTSNFQFLSSIVIMNSGREQKVNYYCVRITGTKSKMNCQL